MKTTKKDFKVFIEEAKKWIGIFGLKDWEVFYMHKEDVSDTRASINVDLNGKIACLYLTPDWEGWDVDSEAIRMVAFHEVCELLIAPLSINAAARYTSADEIVQATYSIIRTLENVLYKNAR